tara:strand:- start:1078 stop:1464 length:387 start_codon:yes stop_codon:yes gene_type:complete
MKMSKKNKSKKETAPETETEIVKEIKENQISITIGELNALGSALQANALSIHKLSPQEQRTQLLNETWEFTQLQVKQIARNSKRQINDLIVEFLKNFPEACEPLKGQVLDDARMGLDPEGPIQVSEEE